MALQDFDKWAIDFIVPINPLGNKIGARYIITATDYVIRWAKAQAAKYCTIDTAAHFIFEQIHTRFGYPKILMSDRGMHFFNQTIQALNEEFRIHHAKSTPYHPQDNGVVEAFKKKIE